MSRHETPLAAWVRLSLIDELSAAGWRRLSARFGSPQRILAQPLATLEAVAGMEAARAIIHGPDPVRLQCALDWQEAADCAILTPDDERYPQLLLETPSAPFVLYARGRLELLRQPSLAIVGSRNATAQGLRNAKDFAKAAAAAGICIVSGLAAGIDAAAHEAALGMPGSTIAVLGNGIDVVYPRQHELLSNRVFAEGLVLSEFPLGTPPLGRNFPRRNRIISGISKGCLVVEAAMASGSLITARLAVEMGRDVFAIPGSIHSPLSRGCHYLIKQGAKLIEEPAEVLEEFGLGHDSAQSSSRDEVPIDEATAKLLKAVGYDACDVDTLIERAGIDAEDLLPLLVQLELDGRISRLADGTFQRVK